MKINNHIKANAVRRIDTAKGPKEAKSESSVGSDRVNVGSKAELEELNQLAMQQPPNEIDMQRLKDAIRSGEYQPDVERLADRLLSDPSTVDQLLAD